VRHGKTIGAPIALRIENRDWANWEKILPVEAAEIDPSTRKLVAPRPGHADLAGSQKFDYHDARYILERASAREPRRVWRRRVGKTPFAKNSARRLPATRFRWGTLKLEKPASWKKIQSVAGNLRAEFSQKEFCKRARRHTRRGFAR